MTSWKTTSFGLLAILSALTTRYFQRAHLSPEIVMTCATAILTGLGLILARDHSGPDDTSGGMPVKVLPEEPASFLSSKTHPRAAALLLASLAALFFSGCATHPRAVAYYSLLDLQTIVDAAEKVYGREVAAGRVSETIQADVDKKIVRFHAGYLVAVRAARADYTTPASPDLQLLADSLVSLIYTFAKEPAP